MISKREKEKRKILDALSKAELSNNRGDVVPTKFRLSKKDRRRSGCYTPQILQKGKISEMIANAEEPAEEYDEWISYRDGFRYGSDINHLFKKGTGCSYMSPEEIRESNKKVRKQIARRKASKKKIR